MLDIWFSSYLICFSGANTVAKTQEADTKRQNALAEKWKTLQNQKCAIAKALQVLYLNYNFTVEEANITFLIST